MLRYIYIFVFLLMNALLLWRIISFLRHLRGEKGAGKAIIGVSCFIGFMSGLVILGHFLQDYPNLRLLHQLSGVWLGVLFYSLCFILPVDLLRLIGKVLGIFPKDFWKQKKYARIVGAVVVVGILATSAYGVIHMRDLKTVYYEVDIDKEVEGIETLRVVLVADQHLGYFLGADYMEEMAAAINAQKPDLVCIAGDIFDNHFDALDDSDRIMEAFKSIQSTYGVYGSWGNHDVEEPLFGGFSVRSKSLAFRDARMVQLMEDAGVQMLNDENRLVEDLFYVVGRLDYSKAGDGTNQRMDIEDLVKGLDQDKPVILIDHEPRELDKIAAAGVDLDVSGHTHAGQIFPMTLTNELIWENGYGLLQKDNMTSIVTSGVGVYGTPMRVLTNSEVAVIDVTFR